MTGTWFDLPGDRITALITTILVIGIKESPRQRRDGDLQAADRRLRHRGRSVLRRTRRTGIRSPPLRPHRISSSERRSSASTASPASRSDAVGAAIIFFAYIGFDSVSTHAEEAKNPRRDVPIGIIVSLVLCTILYIAVAAILTGMVPYNQINIDAPCRTPSGRPGCRGPLPDLARRHHRHHLLLLVMMLSQARILLAMARDGLLPASFFGAVHDRFRTAHSRRS